MHIVLLRPLPDPTRWSMDRYTGELKRAMEPLLHADESIEVFPAERDQSLWGSNLSSNTGKLKRYLQQYVLYGQAIQKLKGDVFHITDHGYGNLIPAIAKGKAIVTFHDALLPRLGLGDVPVRHKPMKSILAQRYALRCMLQASFVIADSDFSRNEFLNFCHYPKMQTGTIHLGIKDFEEKIPSESSLRKQWDLGDRRVLLVVGRSDAHKNVEGALRILKKLVFEKGQKVVLLKVGSDFTSSQKEMISAMKLEDFVRAPGVLSEAELRGAYLLSDLLLFLSWYEGFGFPALEAMQMNLPVVVSNRGSLPEIVGQAALVVNPEDEELVASKVVMLLENESARQDFIRRGKEHVKGFTWQKTAEEVLKVYRSVYQNNLKNGEFHDARSS